MVQEERIGVVAESSDEGRAAVDPEEVLSYWFPEDDIFNADQQTLGRQMQWWFQGGPEVDTEITERFGQVLEQARRGELDYWAQTPRGRLALIIVLDQFSRNIYRGSPLSYTQDPKTLELAVGGIDLGMDRELSPSHHEEEAANAPPHRRAMAEFGISQARAVRDVIVRFGHHPHRNLILGRTSTPEELEYLRTETPPHLRQPPS